MNGAYQMSESSPLLSSPVTLGDRIESFDVLRGVAILGILIMNIQGYAMIQAAYLNPSAYGDLSGLNGLVWKLSHLVADMKFLTIFSMLFGAGIVLMNDRVLSQGGRPASRHYRRMSGLLVIGIIHAYLLWHGDILVAYSLCGFFVFLFRNRKPRTLLILGTLFLVVPTVLNSFSGWGMQYWPDDAMQGMMEYWAPTAEAVSEELAAFRGSWPEQMEYRVPSALFFHTFVFLFWGGWRIVGVMLWGMALHKWGVFSAKRSRNFYASLAAVGFVVGYSLVTFGMIRNIAADWAIEYSFFYGPLFNYWGSLLVGLAYVSLVMLVCKSGILLRVKGMFAAVGRTALSNYLLQTLICTTIFYSQGFGLLGQVERTGQILIVFGVWVVQVTASVIWVRHFRFGPVEWLWRSATYGRLQPIRLSGRSQTGPMA